jgi:hypothetical protein
MRFLRVDPDEEMAHFEHLLQDRGKTIGTPARERFEVPVAFTVSLNKAVGQIEVGEHGEVRPFWAAVNVTVYQDYAST